MAIFEVATFSTLSKLLIAARKLATDTDPLNRIKAIADIAQNSKALSAAINDPKLSQLALEMEKRAKYIDAFLTHEGSAKDDARLIFWQVAPHALADPVHLTGGVLDAEVATELMVKAIKKGQIARDFDRTTFAEAYFRQVMAGTLAVMLANKEYIDSISPALWRQSLENQDIQIEWLEHLDTKLDAQTRFIQTLYDRLAKMEEAAEARAVGVSEKALLRLVNPIAENIADRDEALLALQEAVQIAKRVQNEGRRGTNLGNFVDSVLRRVTALSGDGEHQAAIAELDIALAQEDAESDRRKIRFLNAATDEHLLDFDAEGAAAKIATRVRLETLKKDDFFETLRDERRIWYESGRDKGLNLHLQVAVALAKIAAEQADTPYRFGLALSDLGTALWTLGQRESRTNRLEDAVTTYRVVLKTISRDQYPLDWAAAQMNLGNVLSTVGEYFPKSANRKPCSMRGDTLWTRLIK